MSQGKQRWGEVTVIAMMVAYIIWFGFLSIRQHEAFMTGGLDLGNVDQAVWNTSRGRFLRMTTMEGQHSRQGLHVEPILLLLVPLYWIVPDPRALLVVQTVVLASGAWAAYQLARWKLGYSTAGVMIAAVYLLAPIIEGANLFQFQRLWLVVALDHSLIFQQDALTWFTSHYVMVEQNSVAGIGIYLFSQLPMDIADCDQ